MAAWEASACDTRGGGESGVVVAFHWSGISSPVWTSNLTAWGDLDMFIEGVLACGDT